MKNSRQLERLPGCANNNTRTVMPVTTAAAANATPEMFETRMERSSNTTAIVIHFPRLFNPSETPRFCFVSGDGFSRGIPNHKQRGFSRCNTYFRFVQLASTVSCDTSAALASALKRK